MKNITNNKLLKIAPIDDLDSIKINEYNKDTWLIEIDNEFYMVVKRTFCNKKGNIDTSTIDVNGAKCYIQDLITSKSKLNVEYGDEDATIVDMHGIDNFRFAKALVFKDSTVRKILLKLNLMQKDKKYLRFGCSGARNSAYHPGGEVFEYSLLNGNNASGISQDVSGYLPEGEEYSTSISLYDEDNEHLRDERIVYLHTALLKEVGIKNTNSVYVKIIPTIDNASFLDILTELAQKLGFNSYSIQTCINSQNTSEHVTNIKGRVLRHMPNKPFDVLQDATDIGLEQVYKLEDCETMYGVGTKYDRYEPEWFQFTGGRQYERRGHIHATVIGNHRVPNSKHEVFHLRDVFVSPASQIEIVLNPIKNVYKIYPVYKNNGNFYCKSTDKNINEVLDGIRATDLKKSN